MTLQVLYLLFHKFNSILYESYSFPNFPSLQIILKPHDGRKGLGATLTYFLDFSALQSLSNGHREFYGRSPSAPAGVNRHAWSDPAWHGSVA